MKILSKFEFYYFKINNRIPCHWWSVTELVFSYRKTYEICKLDGLLYTHFGDNLCLIYYFLFNRTNNFGFVSFNKIFEIFKY